MLSPPDKHGIFRIENNLHGGFQPGWPGVTPPIGVSARFVLRISSAIWLDDIVTKSFYQSCQNLVQTDTGHLLPKLNTGFGNTAITLHSPNFQTESS